MAATAPAIQVVIPPKMTSPVVAPPPPPPSAATSLGHMAIIDFTKARVLPDPDTPVLQACNKNTATQVLAAAIYSTLERKFFDNTHSRMEVATAFGCNVSQLTKALTGIEYASGLHYYKPKRQASKKRAVEEDEPSEDTLPKRQKATPKTGEHTTTFELRHTGGPDKGVLNDTLESESSSSDLPPGL